MTTETFPLVWDLDSLAPNPERAEFQDDFQQLADELESLATAAGQLDELSTESAGSWANLLQRWEQVLARLSGMHAHVGCHAAADASNACFQQWEARLAAVEPLRQRIGSALETRVGHATEESIDAACAADAGLAEVRFYLDELKLKSQLRFPEELEDLASELAVDGLHAWGRLYDRVSGSLRIPIQVKGEITERSPGQVHFDSADRGVRENNFHAADKAWSTIGDVCAESINHIAGSRLTRYRRLELKDHLDAPLIYNRMQRKTLETMWSVIAERKSVLLKYFEAKARLIGVDKLSWFDQQAPLPQAAQSSELTYDRACETIIDTFTGFSGDFGEFARMALKEGWIEAENRTGKRQGGFCTGYPLQKQSRIFMTYTNSPDSMSTLAHELGHAYHSWVLRDQPLLLQDYPMNLAETASTFAEAVLGQQRLEMAESNAERLVIYDNLLSDSVAFLMNIHARFIFEDRFHQERVRGEVSRSRLSDLMLEAQKEAYLDGLADDGWNSNFWISKLHFYISELPFYNFPYTFGYLLSLGVYAVSKDFGDEFPDRYRRLLLATGCEMAETAVQSTLGHDLAERSFWDRSLDVVEQRVGEFLTLADEFH